MQVIRTLFAYLGALVVTTGLASVFNSHQILAGHKALGAEIPMGDQIATYWGDFLNFTPSFGMVIAIAFAVAFGVAYFMKRVIKPLAIIAYPLAGAAAMATILVTLEIVFDGSGVIGGAQSTVGFGLQCLAGTIGGAFFMMLRPR